MKNKKMIFGIALEPQKGDRNRVRTSKEEKMKNKRLWLGMLAMVLVLVMASPACVKAQTDTRLNGTWKDEDGYIIKYNSGNCELLEGDDIPNYKGTYTTSNGKIAYTWTHIFGTSFGLDARWYSKDELDKGFSEEFEPNTDKYAVNGNKLTLTHDDDDGETYTFTLVSRGVKFTQSTDNSKKSVPVSSGSVSSFPGRWVPEHGGEAPSGLPDNLELFKDGTGVCEGMSISWKVENGRFILTSSLFGGVWNYKMSDNKLILTDDRGKSETYKKVR